MPLDPVIAGGFRPVELPDPLQQYARVSAIQNAQNQNALAQYQLSQAQRQDQEQNALTQWLRQPNRDLNDPAQQREGYGIAPNLFPNLLEKNVKARESTSKIRLADAQSLDKEMLVFRSFAPMVNTPEAAYAFAQSMYRHPTLGPIVAGIVPPDKGAQVSAELFAKDPFEWRKAFSGLSAEKLMELEKGVRQHRDAGGQIIGETIDYRGRVVPGSQVVENKTVTPGEAARIPIEQGRLAVDQGQLEETKKRTKMEQERLDIAKQGLEPLPPKEITKREAVYPKQTQAISAIEDNAQGLIKDLEALRDHPGLSGMTGLVAGRTPNLTGNAREAQALYDKVVSKGTLGVLTALRQASPTGGALGNVSDKDVALLRSSFGALAQTQNTSSVKKAINDVIEDVKGMQRRAREAYDLTYEYRKGKTTSAPESDWKDM